MPQDSGSGKACRWVSAERLASATTLRTASSTQPRVRAHDRSTGPLPGADAEEPSMRAA